MKITCLLILAQLIFLATFCQEKPQLLYPDGVPNSKPTPDTYVEKDNTPGRRGFVSIPTITPYLVKNGTATGTGVIIFPGGGYSILAIDKEGDSIARAFNQIGINAFVIKYRLPSDEIMIDKTIGPLQDAQQAILTVRQNAATWGIKAGRVGIIGFSAGVHLASTAGTHLSRSFVAKGDSVSIRPDFMILMYPVISLESFAHVGSRDKLLGKNATADKIKEFSNDKQVTSRTPPTFIVHATDDNVVPVQNSILFYQALLAAGVPAEMHIYQAGGHGFGLNNPKATDKWFDRCAGWLKENGF